MPVNAIAGFIAAGAATIAVDQTSKAVVRARVAPGERIEVGAGIGIEHVRNDGASLGMFPGINKWATLGAAAAAPAAALWLARSGSANPPLAAIGAGLVAGGGIGNFVDRARDGAVTDFISLDGLFTCNVADVAITAGLAVLGAAVLLHR